LPAPVSAWTGSTFPGAKSLNLAAYTCDGSGDHPNGVAFHALRPILAEAFTRSGATFPSSATGTRTVMSSTGTVTSGMVVLDTAGYYGLSQDQPGSGYYEYLAAVKGSAGDGVTPGGWVLLSHHAPITAGTTQVSVSADFEATGGIVVSGTRQAAVHSEVNCPFFLDLAQVGNLTWAPALTVYDTDATAAAVVVNTADPSGQTCRLCAAWAAVSATVSGQAVWTASGTYPWTAPGGVTSVTVAATGAGGGGGGGDASGADDYGGGGGGGGEFSQGTVGITPANDYTVTVGAGGAGGSAGSDGVAGGLSVFAGDTQSVTGHGGGGGGGATTTGDGTGGDGGSGSASTAHYDGGDGAAGATAMYAGGGGSSAGTGQAGAAATTAAGAPAPAGGGGGGAGGAGSFGVVQRSGGSGTGSNEFTVMFAAPVQAGNGVMAFAYYQAGAISGSADDPTGVLNDGTALAPVVTADMTGLDIPFQAGLLAAWGVPGGEQSVTITGYGTGNPQKVIICECWEVSGLGPSPQTDQATSHTQGGSSPTADYECASPPGPATQHAPELWVACTAAQFTTHFGINFPPGSQDWDTTARLFADNGGAYGGLMAAWQVRDTTDDLWFAGTFSTGVSKGTFAASFITSAATVGSAPVTGPGGGGGGGLAAGNAGGAGASGQVTLTWQGASGSGYATPALPAPYTAWTPATTVGSGPGSDVDLNGPDGIAGPLNFLSSPPVFRISATTAQPVAATTLTQVAFTATTPTVDSYTGWDAATGQYVVQRAGLYLFHGLVAFAASATAARRAGVTVNGTTYWGPPSTAPPAGTANLGKTQIFSLHAGDTVSLCCRQDSGSAIDLATTDQTRFLLVWLGGEGVPASLWTPPDATFRWASGTQGENLGGDLSTLLQAHLANDLGFLVNRPYFVGYQTVAQTGLATGAASTVALDTVGSPTYPADVGDNYSGWSSGAPNAYVAQEPGWYLVTGEFFAAAASTSAALVTAGAAAVTSGGWAPSSTPDWYQALAATTTSGTGGGAALFGVYYLLAGEQVSPQVMASGSGYGSTYATQVGEQNGGYWNPHFEVIWLSG
jgi:hypothetical protein